MLFGTNKLAPMLLATLNIDEDSIPRFRDCFIDDGLIVIHTRTGGGNREYYESQNEELTEHPNYLHNSDDEFDCTYANFYYSFPDEYKDDLTKISQGNVDIKPSEKWQALFNKLQA